MFRQKRYCRFFSINSKAAEKKKYNSFQIIKKLYIIIIVGPVQLKLYLFKCDH